MSFINRIQRVLATRSNVTESPDPTPVALPIGYKRPLTLNEQILNMIRSQELRRFAEGNGQETLEEADDFEVGDDFDPQAPYEMDFDHDLGKEITRAEKTYLDAHRNAFDKKVAIAKKSKRYFTQEKPAAKPVKEPADEADEK